MPLQALFLDEMIDNDTELIALNSNDDDIFYLISQTKSERSCSSHTRILRRGYSKVHRPLARPSVLTSFSNVQANSRAIMFTAG